jgi:hypothetical protein
MSDVRSDPARAFLDMQKTRPSYWTRLALATLGAAAIGFAIHVLYGRGWAEAYVQTAARAGRLSKIIREPYPASVVIVASITALLPTAGKVIAFLWLRDNLPGRSRLVKGLWYGVLLTAMTDALIRVPLMSIVIGNPVDVMLVQSLEGWMIGPAMGIAIAILVPSQLGHSDAAD